MSGHSPTTYMYLCVILIDANFSLTLMDVLTNTIYNWLHKIKAGLFSPSCGDFLSLLTENDDNNDLYNEHYKVVKGPSTEQSVAVIRICDYPKFDSRFKRLEWCHYIGCSSTTSKHVRTKLSD